jgi:hypothetical protein
MLVRLLEPGIAPGCLRVHHLVVQNVTEPKCETALGGRLPPGFLDENRILPASHFRLADREARDLHPAARSFEPEPLGFVPGRAHRELSAADHDHARTVGTILKSLRRMHTRGKQHPCAEKPFPALLETP